MTKTNKIFISTGLFVSLIAMAFWVPSCLAPTVSRVPVPGSSMTAVVTADLAGCYDVELYDHGHPIDGGFQCLGPYASQKCTLDKVTSVSNIVTIDWSDGYRYSVSVDVNARRFIAFSNGVSVAFSNGLPVR